MKKILSLFFVFTTLLITNLSCDDNPLVDLDKDETDASLWFQAKIYINQKQYQLAIDTFDQVSDAFKNKRENVVEYSSAYAGLCGLDLLDLVTNSNDLGGLTPMQFFMSAFRAASVTKVTACQTAVKIIEDNSSADPAVRSEDENISMMAILMALLGTELNARLDQNDDGMVDIGHDDLCTTTPVTDLTAANYGANLSKLFGTASNLSVIDLLDDIKKTITDGCASLDAFGLNFCSKTDPATFTANEIRGVRSLLQEGQVFGAGSCVGSPNNLQNCVCL